MAKINDDLIDEIINEVVKKNIGKNEEFKGTDDNFYDFKTVNFNEKMGSNSFTNGGLHARNNPNLKEGKVKVKFNPTFKDYLALILALTISLTGLRFELSPKEINKTYEENLIYYGDITDTTDFNNVLSILYNLQESLYSNGEEVKILVVQEIINHLSSLNLSEEDLAKYLNDFIIYGSEFSIEFEEKVINQANSELEAIIEEKAQADNSISIIYLPSYYDEIYERLRQLTTTEDGEDLFSKYSEIYGVPKELLIGIATYDGTIHESDLMHINSIRGWGTLEEQRTVYRYDNYNGKVSKVELRYLRDNASSSIESNIEYGAAILANSIIQSSGVLVNSDPYKEDKKDAIDFYLDKGTSLTFSSTHFDTKMKILRCALSSSNELSVPIRYIYDNSYNNSLVYSQDSLNDKVITITFADSDYKFILNRYYNEIMNYLKNNLKDVVIEDNITR